MTLHSKELIDAAEMIAQRENMKVNLKYTAAASTFTGMTTAGGGIFGGPVGLLGGAILGGLLSFFYTQGKFKSVVEVIREMNEAERQRLSQHLHNAIRDVDILDAIHLMNIIMNGGDIYFIMADALKCYLTNELSYEVSSRMSGLQ